MRNIIPLPILKVFTHMRVLFDPIAGRECVYPLLFPRVGIVLQRLRFFFYGCVMCKTTDRYNCALCPHFLSRIHFFPNRYAMWKLAFAFFFLCIRMFSLRRCDIFYLCVVVKSTASSGCTFLRESFLCLRGIFHLNADFKAVYAFTFFLYCSLHLHMRMFFDALVSSIITQPSHYTLRCCFAMESRVFPHHNAACKTALSCFFIRRCVYNWYMRLFLYVWVTTKLTYPLHSTLMRVSTLRWRAFFTGNVSLKCACTFCFPPLSMFFQQIRVFCDTHVILQPTNTSHFMRRCGIL